MSGAFHFEPNKSVPLSAREKRILAGIENDLRRTDHRFAERMADDGWTPMWFRAGGVPPVVALSVALVLLGLLSVLMPASAWVVVALLMASVGVPWLVWRATQRGGAG
jgi:Flp pilus assembly protein TadB